MNKTLIAVIVVIVVIAGAIVVFGAHDSRNPNVTQTPPVSSTTPPTATGTTPVQPPPTPQLKGTVKGAVLLGPTCPVERIPPDPACAPKQYQTTIRIQPINPSAPYTTISTDAKGTFSVSLNPGTYTLTPQGGGSMPPTCRALEVQISSGETKNINLDCDTGIR